MPEQGMKQAKNIPQPLNHRNDHNTFKIDLMDN